MKCISILFFVLLMACTPSKPTNISMFKTGTFKTYLDDTDNTSIAYRKDSIQIETYKGKKDTFTIQWLSDFEYVLKAKHPKNELDRTPFHVKITGFKEHSYTFIASYKGSNFKQKGKAVKIN